MIELEKILHKLIQKSQLSAYSHFGAAKRMSKLHFYLGIPIAIISAFLASVIFRDIESSVPNLYKWIAGSLSLVAIMLSIFQTFINPKEGRSKHRELGNNYLSVSRKAEIFLAEFHDGISDKTKLSEAINNLNREYDSINKSAQDFETNEQDYLRAKNKMQGYNKGYDKNDTPHQTSR